MSKKRRLRRFLRLQKLQEQNPIPSNIVRSRKIFRPVPVIEEEVEESIVETIPQIEELQKEVEIVSEPLIVETAKVPVTKPAPTLSVKEEKEFEPMVKKVQKMVETLPKEKTDSIVVVEEPVKEEKVFKKSEKKETKKTEVKKVETKKTGKKSK